MGRPTKYRPRFIKTARNYLEECKNQKKIPFLEELASKIKVTERTLSNWGEANEGFLQAVEEIMDHQRMAIKVMGLKSPSMLIFLLKANHGMMRTEKRQHEGPNGGPVESIIFTDVATWRHAEENKLKQQATEQGDS